MVITNERFLLKIYHTSSEIGNEWSVGLLIFVTKIAIFDRSSLIFHRFSNKYYLYQNAGIECSGKNYFVSYGFTCKGNIKPTSYVFDTSIKASECISFLQKEFSIGVTVLLNAKSFFQEIYN